MSGASYARALSNPEEAQQTPSVAGPQYAQALLDPAPGFDEWFGNSRVTDAAGNPKVVYHGTNKAFEAFDPSKGKQRTDAPAFASFFTDDPDLASSYAKRSGRSGQNVRPAYLSLQNPAETTGRSWFALNSPFEGPVWSDRYGQYVNVRKGDEIDINTLAKMARKHGHDGLIAHNIGDAARERDVKPQTTYAVFGPHQVRSAIGGRR